MQTKRAFSKKGLCLLLVVAFCWMLQAGSCRAAETSAASHKEVAKLLKLTNAASIGLKMGQLVSNQLIDAMNMRNPNLPPQEVAAIKDEVGRVFAENMPKLMSQMADIYARHFSRQEIEGLIAFYETPLGRKAIRELPAIMNESFRLGQTWGRSLVPELRAKLKARLEKEGFVPKKSPGGAAH